MDQASSNLINEELIARIEKEKKVNLEVLETILGKSVKENAVENPDENKSSTEILKDIFGEENPLEFEDVPEKPEELPKLPIITETPQEDELSEGEINSEDDDSSKIEPSISTSETSEPKKVHKKKKKKKDKSSKPSKSSKLKKKDKESSHSKSKHHKRSKSHEILDSNNEDEDHDFYASYKKELKRKNQDDDHLRKYHDTSFEEEDDIPIRRDSKRPYDTYEHERYSRSSSRDHPHPAEFLLDDNRKSKRDSHSHHYNNDHPNEYGDVQQKMLAMAYSRDRETYHERQLPMHDPRFSDDSFFNSRFNNNRNEPHCSSSGFKREFDRFDGRNQRLESESSQEGKANWEKYKRQKVGRDLTQKDTFHDDLIRSLDKPDCRQEWREWSRFKKEKKWPSIDSNFISNGFKDLKDEEDERVIKGTTKPLPSNTSLLNVPAQTITTTKPSTPPSEKGSVVEKQDSVKSVATVAPIPRTLQIESEPNSTTNTVSKEESPAQTHSVPNSNSEKIDDLTKINFDFIIAQQLKEIRETVISTSEKIVETPILPNATENDFYFEGKHPVSYLMEFCSKNRHRPPNFQLINDEGPAHMKRFVFKVEVNGVEYEPTVSAQTKKLAKAYAAAFCLKSIMSNLPPPSPVPPPNEIRNKRRVGVGRLDRSWKSSLNRLISGSKSSHTNPYNPNTKERRNSNDNFDSYYN